MMLGSPDSPAYYRRHSCWGLKRREARVVLSVRASRPCGALYEEWDDCVNSMKVPPPVKIRRQATPLLWYALSLPGP